MVFKGLYGVLFMATPNCCINYCLPFAIQTVKMCLNNNFWNSVEKKSK